METNLPVFEVFAKGQRIVFTSAFADTAAALAALRALPNKSEFAVSLLSRARLTDGQIPWVHKLATDGTRGARPAAAPVVEGLNLLPIVGLLQTAKAAGKKFPAIALRTATGGTVKLALAGERSKQPGTVNITDGRGYGSNVWFGRIGADGAVAKSRDWHEQVEQLLRALAADPAHVAGQHGISTGQCCFCGLALTDARSRSVGYGPVCAETFGMPWGDTTAADEADAAAKAPLVGPVDPFAGLGVCATHNLPELRDSHECIECLRARKREQAVREQVLEDGAREVQAEGDLHRAYAETQLNYYEDRRRTGD